MEGCQHESEAFNDDFEFFDGETKKKDFCFMFRFPTYEEFCKSKNEIGQFVSSTKSFSSFIQEPEVVDNNMIVKELGSDMNIVSMIDEDDTTADRLLQHEDFKEELKVKSEGMKFMNEETELLFQSEKDSLCTDSSDTVSIGFDHMRSLMGRLVDSYSDDFLSDEDFGGEFELDSLKDIHGDSAELNFLETSEENQESGVFENCNVMEELTSLEQNTEKLDSEFLSQNDFREDLNDSEESENVKSSNADVNKLECLWEHQELIEQLQMELKKVRATGLPTICEETEYPKMEDLKPWKIDERFGRQDKDSMCELHKFYKSYREKMRKFDILTYQKMYAIGFLQKDPLKDSLQLVTSQRSSGPALKSFISQNIWLLFKHKSHDIDIDPMVKFTKELQSDLEVVYVGHMCLSWEFLHWQYVKALNLCHSHTYNEVAGEFQQFQVLIQRFIENEPFQGPRVQHYIKSRRDLRYLLQVPVIREDRLKDRNKARARDHEKVEHCITIDMLVEILEESIRTFWRFVRADRDCCSIATLKGQKGTQHPELQSPEDIELLLEVRRSLEKKEKKLKEVLRSESCIFRRRFGKSKEDDSDHVLYFFSQVDMKLVGRVLNMSRLTIDQLVWCHSKLSRISFVQRKIHVEPSFLLFPC